MSETTQYTPTRGSITLAEILTNGGSYLDDRTYPTPRGDKTVKGLAAMIDDVTAIPELLEALEELLEVPMIPDQATISKGKTLNDNPRQGVVNMCVSWERILKARAVIAKSKGLPE